MAEVPVRGGVYTKEQMEVDFLNWLIRIVNALKRLFAPMTPRINHLL
jgi:hypothetical protein